MPVNADNRELRRIKQPSKRTKVANRIRALAITQRAFRDAEALCRHIETHPNLDIGAWAAAMAGISVSYGKPFTQNNGVSPAPPELLEFSDPGQETLHRDLTEGRNWVHAHSDRINAPELISPDERAECWKVFVNVYEAGRFQLDLPKLPTLQRDKVPEVKALCALQIGRLDILMATELRKLITGYAPVPGRYELNGDFPPKEHLLGRL